MNYEEIFKPQGILSRVMTEYEFRECQLEMSRLVEKAFSEKNHYIIEAGTGTGKTLAYLLPASQVGERVVISTGTKNLQEQLFYKDIPFIKKNLGLNFKIVLVKGRGNYLCKRRLIEFRVSGELRKNEISHFKRLEAWSRVTETGDISEVSGLPEEPEFWKEINARGEICLGSRCSFFEDCYISSLRRRASGADLILVNHYLLFADRAVKFSGYGEVLPEYRYLVMDEAHLVEGIAAGYFGSRVSDYQLLELTGDVRKEYRKLRLKGEDIEKAATEIEFNTGFFFDRFRGKEDRYRIDSLKKDRKVRESYALLNSSLISFSLSLKEFMKKHAEMEPLVHRTLSLSDELRFIMETSEGDYVYWAEQTKRTAAVNSTPLVISDLLRDQFFKSLNSSVLTSATLAMAGDFSFIKERLGLEQAEAAMLPSEFDFNSRAMLYIPKDMPLPSDKDFYDKFTERALEIIRITGGRAFLLFTSFKGMKETYKKLEDAGEFNLLVQGELAKRELLEEFRGGERMVLLGSMSFWQGVDVQGDDLTCVIIDKLPFAVPTDPIVSATVEYIRSRRGDPFYSYQLPQAVMLFKQGLGRLIRHRSDYGIAAIMDKRLLTMKYGKSFLQSIPPFKRTSDIAVLQSFYKAVSKGK